MHVTNLGQTDSSGPTGSNLYSANSFRTGGASDYRFPVTSVIIDFNGFNPQQDTIRISSNSSSNTPGTQIGGNLTQVGTATGGNITFNAPSSGITLNGGTTYWVVIRRSATPTVPDGTTSDAEDTDSADGWSIGNVAYNSSNGTSWTAAPNGQALRFRVNATLQVPNYPPRFIWPPMQRLTTEENRTLAGYVIATDRNPEDEVWRYETWGGEDQSHLTVNFSGALTFFRAAPDYENPRDADGDNVYEVVIRATSGYGDRQLRATQLITVRVTDVDETDDPGGPAPPPPDDTGGGTGGGGGTAPGPPQSSDAALSGLGISDVSIVFDPGKETYTAYAPHGTGTVTVTPTARHGEAEITVNGERTQSGESVSIDLEDEETRIEITVTAEDGTVRTYTVTVTTSCPEERRVLESFYEETGGESWHSNENWNSQKPPGQWYGVRTDDEGRVISLRLAGNGLSGEVPENILCLELKELALWDNDGLRGEVPQELALAVERAALRDVAEALSLNKEWFDNYEEPYEFRDWHTGVTTDSDGRVTELDLTGEGIRGEIPRSVFELRRLEGIRLGCGVSLGEEAPEGVRIMMPDECPEETAETGGGGCALGSVDSSASGLFLVSLFVFGALAGRRVRG